MKKERLKCGHLKTKRIYFERDHEDKLTGNFICSRCYAKKDTWLNSKIKIEEGGEMR